ncbi:MAG: hypothetical protein K7J47_04980 [Acidobacteria bacterium]|jgi:hypothetical protein|nr:hypothetical protein [Bryobacteraceae bacterium CoA2 C42]
MRSRPESGFAMLLVFAMAAALAWVLYMELPRLAFEAQRNKEQLLVERGEQYIRGVEVFVRKNKKLPQTIEELEQTNGTRFLRKRYKDPLTGTDDWRLIHADATGRMTDSLVQKQPKPGEAPGTGGEAANPYAVGSTVTLNADPNAPVAGGPRRESERPGSPGMVPPPPGGEGGAPPPPGAVPTAPGLPGPFAAPGTYPNAAANSQTGGQMAQPQPQSGGGGYTVGGGGYTVGGMMPPDPARFNATPANNGQLRLPGSGSTSFGPPMSGPMTGQGATGINVNPATDMIRRLLTTPNPQGLAAAMGAQQSQGLGGGIVGIASKLDREGIKIYNEKTNYKEWEFVYDPAKQAGAGGNLPGQRQGMGGAGMNPGGIPMQGMPPSPFPGMNPGAGQGRIR